MKKAIIIIITIIIVAIIGIFSYLRINKISKIDITSEDIPIQSETANESNNVESMERNSNIEIGTTYRRNFIIDNVYHSKKQGDINFASYYPENYDKTKEYAIYFALPGWEGLYFQGVGANMGEPYPYEAQSANDTIELVEYFLDNYNIDKNKVYISGASGGA